MYACIEYIFFGPILYVESVSANIELGFMFKNLVFQIVFLKC